MIGIIFAMQIEADGVLAAMEDKKTETAAQTEFISGRLYGKEVAAAVCGVGKVNAAKWALAMIMRYSPDCVINSGVAGAVSPMLEIGDIVVAERAVEHDMNCKALGHPRGEVIFPDEKVTYFNCDKNVFDTLYGVGLSVAESKVVKGTVASGDIFVSDYDDRIKIGKSFSALACDMEGAAIAHVCFRTKTKCGIIRAVSDDLLNNTGEDFNKFCETASKNTVKIIEGFVRAYH